MKINPWKVTSFVLAGALAVTVGGSAIKSASASSGTSSVLPAPAEKQMRMRKALNLLFAARAELDNAEEDKGGHRVKAIEHANRAIEETKAGIDWAQ